MDTEKNIPISEKIKFWEEQDKINQAVIPRIIELNDSLQKLSTIVSKVDEKIASAESRILTKTNKETRHTSNKYISYIALLISIVSLILAFTL